ncbi:hypothetical protein [Nesterenkonia rhizosphaerae]|uniref:Uncharacterized protein n=1 Tax=Nesterenkonia rhizosphaerae TaxID=1348272 RepID=A0ABP9FZS6_9MICC
MAMRLSDHRPETIGNLRELLATGLNEVLRIPTQVIDSQIIVRPWKHDRVMIRVPYLSADKGLRYLCVQWEFQSTLYEGSLAQHSGDFHAGTALFTQNWQASDYNAETFGCGLVSGQADYFFEKVGGKHEPLNGSWVQVLLLPLVDSIRSWLEHHECAHLLDAEALEALRAVR